MRRVLIVGGSGMLGYTLVRHLVGVSGLDVHATFRQAPSAPLPEQVVSHAGQDAMHGGGLERLIEGVRPDEVINCVGIIKQIDKSIGPAASIALNSLLPHRLAEACKAVGARLIQFSTDCVFSGKKGHYSEADLSDADDLYGRSKRLGEVDYGNNLTLRTSLIGHELRLPVSLIDWFLSQTGTVKGFRKAVFSGLPTVEIARILRDFVLPRNDLVGLYHLAASPIDKFSLLEMVGERYKHQVQLVPVDSPKIDRSLDGRRLAALLGYEVPNWDVLIEAMHSDFLASHASLRIAR